MRRKRKEPATPKDYTPELRRLAEMYAEDAREQMDAIGPPVETRDQRRARLARQRPLSDWAIGQLAKGYGAQHFAFDSEAEEYEWKVEEQARLERARELEDFVRHAGLVRDADDPRAQVEALDAIVNGLRWNPKQLVKSYGLGVMETLRWLDEELRQPIAAERAVLNEAWRRAGLDVMRAKRDLRPRSPGAEQRREHLRDAEAKAARARAVAKRASGETAKRRILRTAFAEAIHLATQPQRLPLGVVFGRNWEEAFAGIATRTELKGLTTGEFCPVDLADEAMYRAWIENKTLRLADRYLVSEMEREPRRIKATRKGEQRIREGVLASRRLPQVMLPAPEPDQTAGSMVGDERLDPDEDVEARIQQNMRLKSLLERLTVRLKKPEERQNVETVRDVMGPVFAIWAAMVLAPHKPTPRKGARATKRNRIGNDTQRRYFLSVLQQGWSLMDGFRAVGVRVEDKNEYDKAWRKLQRFERDVRAAGHPWHEPTGPHILAKTSD